MFFKKRDEKAFDKFVADIKLGGDSVLEMIGLSENRFSEVAHDKLLDNPDDIAAGVIKVKTKFHLDIFGIFENALIKEHDNGDIKYIFYTTTTDPKKVIEIRDVLFKHLGLGRYDSDRHTSFQETEKIKSLANKKFTSDNDDLVNVWVLDKVTVLLQYRTNPLNQFSLFVTKTTRKSINRDIRRNGTILNLLKTNFSLLTMSQEESKHIELKEGAIKFIDYNYTLPDNELGIFDKLQVRQFGEVKDPSFKVSTNLTFTLSRDFPIRRLIEVTEQLIKVYGDDDGGTGELEVHEIDMIERKTYWTGRSWNFNERHGIWDLENSEQRYAYTVTISYDSFDTGFTLTILSYNNLLDLFSVR